MFGTMLATIIGICILIFGVVIVCVAVSDYFMDGSWRWGVRDDSKRKEEDKKDEH